MLEVYFSPMTVISREIVVDEDDLEDKTDAIDLNKQLEKALSDENYELASKIRDLIDIYKKQK
jgi:protein-arginine kinase activator protein McsA